MRERLRASWFSLGLVFAVLAAWVFPQLGAKDGPFGGPFWIRGGTVLVFLVHGTRLALSDLRYGALSWKSHVLAQAFCFVGFPALGLLLAWSLTPVFPEPVRVGLVYMCALPTTISSAVVLTGIARGSVPVALFDATLSSLLGILLTPLWLGVWTQFRSMPGDTPSIVAQLFLLMVAPILVGQLLRPGLVRMDSAVAAQGGRLASALLAVKGFLGIVDRLVVLFIVYVVFCDAIVSQVVQRVDARVLLILLAICLGLFGLSTVLARRLGLALGLSRGESTATTFCAATKSLAVGVPMATILFGDYPELGLLLLPTMIYHPLQLLLGGVLAERWRRSSRNP